VLSPLKFEGRRFVCSRPFCYNVERGESLVMLNTIRGWWKRIVSILAFLAAAFTVLDYLLKWGILSWLWIQVGRLAHQLATYWVGSVLVVYGVALLALYVTVYRLQKYVGTSFKDDFKQDLKKNWDYHGKWELVPGGELSVTQSELGGITKVGHL